MTVSLDDILKTLENATDPDGNPISLDDSETEALEDQLNDVTEVEESEEDSSDPFLDEE